ncbi:GtrA family protein [Spirulina subsalsa FACHB-351]|uniref:GtrA family protein n=1 Tax=Spirulina subsalsa FACHB-351 TaxID=234711 RepID=A0ABT3L163_9CYAN|nr:GtrA family protein [Spirulina subsalsa]MCW6035231.1 GtrA family protein [Spirulina subsalsa FACHB-351]
MNQLQTRITNFYNNSVVRWWIIGLFFTGINFPVLYVLVELLRIPEIWATLLAAEISTLLRFPLNDRWVFGYRYPTLKRLWQYHVSTLSGFLIWWGGTVIFIEFFGIHYMISALLATCISVGWNMATNFLWVWKKKSSED